MAIDLSTAGGSAANWAAPSVHAFSVDEYHRLGASGVLGLDKRVELIEGLIYDMTPIGAPHATSVQKTLAALWELPLGSAAGVWHVRVQQPLTLSHSEPQPDLAIVRGTPDDYASRHPGSGDVGLVIEVADASLEFDRGRKLTAYAAEGIEAYWIVDLAKRRLDIYGRANDGSGKATYSDHATAGEADAVCVTLDGEHIGEIRVRDLFA